MEHRNAPALVAAGPEFQVNTTALITETRVSDVAMDANGNFVVVWGSTLGNVGDARIRAQRFDSSGLALGPEFFVGPGSAPSIAMSPAGNFVISWGGFGGVSARRYDASGTPLGNQFTVNTTPTATSNNVTYGNAMDPAGNFIITWIGSDDSWDAFARIYNSAGVPIGDEFRVNTYATGAQIATGLAFDSDGDFVVVWQSQDVSNNGVYAKRYNSAGVAQGDEVRVNTGMTPGVAMTPAGDFVVAWSGGQDGSNGGVYAQRYDANGQPLGSEFRVNTYTSGNQGDLVRVRCDAAGNFVVAWRSDEQDGSGYGIYAQSYTAQGVPSGAEFQVNTSTVGNQTRPAVAMAPDGDVVTTWVSNYPSYQVRAQRYTNESSPSVVGVQVNDGSTQRSRVADLSVTFSAQVTVAGSIANAFTLTRIGGGSVAFTATASVINGVTVVTLNNFTGPETEFGSLRDGNYTLTALASQISANGQPMTANYTFEFFRFYGDMNGDRRVDISDFGFFSLAFLQPLNYNAALDFNNDGRIDIADFGQFSARFFTMLP